jgi:hypothetical protein
MEWRDDLPAVRSMEPCHHLDPRLDALIDNARLWKPCCDSIGCGELSLFSDKLNVKRPGGAPLPWHQEGPYWANRRVFVTAYQPVGLNRWRLYKKRPIPGA